MDEALEKAIAHREKLLRKLKEIDEFIEQYKLFKMEVDAQDENLDNRKANERG